MDEIGVRLNVWRLFCYHHGADEKSSVPYLWVVGFKLDGSTLQQRSNRLSWRPELFLSRGSHGSLLTPTVDPGMKIAVPPAVGTWNTTLTPLVLRDEQDSPTTIAGWLGFVAVVVEEDHDIPDRVAEAGHQALNQYVADRIEQFATGLDLAEFRAAVQRRVRAGRPPELAFPEEVAARLDVLEEMIVAGLPDAVSGAMRRKLGVAEHVWAGLERDVIRGVVCHVVSADSLLAEPDFTLDFHDRIRDEPHERTDNAVDAHYAYNLRTAVKAKVRRRILQPRLPDAHDIEIQGVARRLSTSLGVPYIYEVGGVVAGQPWWLSRSEAVALISRGAREFHVRTPDGGQLPVTLLSPNGSRWSYLTTTLDGQRDNELLALPDLAVLPGFFRSVYEPDPTA